MKKHRRICLVFGIAVLAFCASVFAVKTTADSAPTSDPAAQSASEFDGVAASTMPSALDGLGRRFGGPRGAVYQLRQTGDVPPGTIAFATASSGVCVAVVGDVAGCAQRLDRRFPIYWFTTGSSTSDAGIAGIVADKVSAIDVMVGDTWQPATIARPGFFFRIPAGNSLPQVQAIRATWGKRHQSFVLSLSLPTA